MFENVGASKVRENSKAGPLRDALMNARERLVAAVAEGRHEDLLVSLRNRIADLLEQIERLNIVHRNRN
jgi:hypothetical protein